jgi:hypothetical protein
MSFKKIFGLFVLIACSLVALKFVVEADKIIQYTPNCLCPSKDKFPPPDSDGVSQLAWCGYELGPECDIQRGYHCDIDMAKKEEKFRTPDCLGGRTYCLPFRNYSHLKYCGSQMKCETILSCKKVHERNSHRTTKAEKNIWKKPNKVSDA